MYKDYFIAFNAAVDKANSAQLPVVIRKCKEYGRTVYNVNFKTNDGSDYLGETVIPGTPYMVDKAGKVYGQGGEITERR